MLNQTELHRTALYELHLELGGKMVPFAGYELPVQYATGIIAEHRHTRARASLFDVSHMGQAAVVGRDPVAALETVVPGDIAGLKPGRQRYTQLTNERGGIIDDLIVTRRDGHVDIVVNAARKHTDYTYLEATLAELGCTVEPYEGRGLLALQGPAAATVLARHAPGCERLGFMEAAAFELDGVPCGIARCGYTGEDGYEISVPADRSVDIARTLLCELEVAPAGLGARDSLRLEAALPLWGHDIDEKTTPVEAGLAWSIGKRRRGEANFPGAGVILDQIENGVARARVGLRPDGRTPAREGTVVADAGGDQIGVVTSGGFGPTVDAPIAMGYVDAASASLDTPVSLIVRAKSLPGRVAAMPFVATHYAKT